MTQNELVKEALEAQMAELKQSMNQAGVKVDAVEVTVGSHELKKLRAECKTGRETGRGAGKSFAKD